LPNACVHRKAEEATDYAAAGYPSVTTSYPYITAEAAATSKTPTEVANAIIAAKSLWIATSAKIEAIRISAKQQIAAATTDQDVTTISQDAITKLYAIV